MTARISLSHPLQIAEVSAPGAMGTIGITFCPGKKQQNALTGAWDRDLAIDLDVIRDWGAATVITLVEPHELRDLSVPDLGPEVRARGIDWLHLSIGDFSPPDHRFETGWAVHRERLCSEIRSGAASSSIARVGSAARAPSPPCCLLTSAWRRQGPSARFARRGRGRSRRPTRKAMSEGGWRVP